MQSLRNTLVQGSATGARKNLLSNGSILLVCEKTQRLHHNGARKPMALGELPVEADVLPGLAPSRGERQTHRGIPQHKIGIEIGITLKL
jgi:hypothetical protein